MTWSAYGLNNYGLGFAPPILGPDGNMWTTTQNGASIGGGGALFQITPAGVVSSASIPTGSNNGSGFSPVITDGTYIYVQQAINYPRNYIHQFSTALAQINVVQSAYNANGGLVRIGSSAISVGLTYGGSLLIAALTLSPLAAGSSSTLGAGAFGFCVYDGTSVWAVSGTSIYSINPSTLATSSWTIPDTYTGGQAQIGLNGNLIYIPTATGVVVWNTSTATGTLYASSQTYDCYYSANLGKVIVSDNAANVYTMPASGGSLTLMVNLMNVTGTVSLLQSWFGDGPAGSLWAANASQNGSGEPSFIFKYLPGGNSIVMVL